MQCPDIIIQAFAVSSRVIFLLFSFFFLSSSLSLSHPFPLPVPLFKGRWRWNEFFFLLCPSFTAESRRAIDEQRRSIVSPIGSFLIAPIQNWTWTFSIRMYMCSIVLIELFSTSLSERWIVSGLLFFFFPSSSSFLPLVRSRDGTVREIRGGRKSRGNEESTVSRGFVARLHGLTCFSRLFLLIFTSFTSVFNR